MIKWPFTNLHELNLDWIVRKMKELESNVTAFAGKVTASAVTGAAGSQAQVSVSGDLDSGTDFVFTIPTGAQGPQGVQGVRGPGGAIYAHSTTDSATSAKTANSLTYLSEPVNPVQGDTFVIQFDEYNSIGSPTLSIDGSAAYPIYGAYGTSNARWESNMRLLLYFDGSAFNIVGARPNIALPNLRVGGLLSDALAGDLNFLRATLPAGSTVLTVTINTVQAYHLIVQGWRYNGMTYYMMTPGSEYDVSGNITFASGNSTLTITVPAALSYDAEFIIFGNPTSGQM